MDSGEYEILRKLCARINCGDAYLGALVKELRSLGVSELLSSGPMEFMGIKLLGKGQNSYVFTCRLVNLDGEYACKVRRPDASRQDLLREGSLTKLANSVGVGPRVIGYAVNVIVMELVRGLPIQEYVVSAGPEELRGVVKDLLWQCRRLDSVGLVHGELSRPQDHVIVAGGKPYIIDFESATLSSRGSNVSQIMNALVLGMGLVQARVRSALGAGLDLAGLRVAIREYKVRRDDESFLRILRLLGLE